MRIFLGEDGWQVKRIEISDKRSCHVAAIIAGVAAVGGAYASYEGSQSGADAQEDAANQANATQLGMYNQNRTDAAPYRETGYQALNALAQGMGLRGNQAGVTSVLPYEEWIKTHGTNTPGYTDNSDGTIDALLPGAIGGLVTGDPLLGNVANRLFGRRRHQGHRDVAAERAAAEAAANRKAYDEYAAAFKPENVTGTGTETDYFHDFGLDDFEKDPGYEFRRSEGQRGIETSAAARGGLLSGAALKGLDRYNQDYATGEYSNAYNRFNNDRASRFNRLSSLAGTGQTAVTNVGNLGQQTANQVGENQLQAGNARAAGNVAAGNAINNTTTTLGNYYLQRQYAQPQSQPQQPVGSQNNIWV